MNFTSAVLAALLAVAATAVGADELRDARALLGRGNALHALDVVDKGLAAQPRDRDLRFLRGLILNELNRPAEAIAVFAKLTEDYPDLPEPYNNLAVIYAQQRQYEKARAALEMAIRTHPSYSTAHENLGDIYARLASQAYDKALQLDSSNVMAQTKLAMIREMMTSGSKSAGARPGAATPMRANAPPAVAALTQAGTGSAAASKPPEPKPTAPPSAAQTPKPAPAPVVASPAPPPSPAPSSAAEKPTGAAPAESAAAAQAVRDWAKAWSRKDVKAYLGHYAADFRLPRGMSRSAWEAERAKRIDIPGSMAVSVEDLQITMQGTDRAEARFRQDYRSARLSSKARKTLRLVKQAGRWRITEEHIGS